MLELPFGIPHQDSTPDQPLHEDHCFLRLLFWDPTYHDLRIGEVEAAEAILRISRGPLIGEPDQYQVPTTRLYTPYQRVQHRLHLEPQPRVLPLLLRLYSPARQSRARHRLPKSLFNQLPVGRRRKKVKYPKEKKGLQPAPEGREDMVLIDPTPKQVIGVARVLSADENDIGGRMGTTKGTRSPNIIGIR